ncbi:MAG: FkbM family methyltransferase [Rhizobiales bacterium]|nr:FkbM family methyltransferase [Hyphomicrobiales bacterium]
MPPKTFHHPIGRFAQWRRKFADRLGRRLGQAPRVVHAQGARFLVDTTDYIDQCIAWDGIWDGPQLDRLAAVSFTAQPIDYFIDVGANSGFYSVMFALRNLARRVVAFEPDPGNYARLIGNLTLNGLDSRVDAHRLALGDTDGEVTLYEGAKWNRGESTIAVPEQTPREMTHVVRQARFDEKFALSHEKIIIKMDVEGYEFHTLAGMQQTLRRNACYVQVELYSDRLDELKRLFADLGYRFVHTESIDHFFTNMTDE